MHGGPEVTADAPPSKPGRLGEQREIHAAAVHVVLEGDVAPSRARRQASAFCRSISSSADRVAIASGSHPDERTVTYAPSFATA